MTIKNTKVYTSLFVTYLLGVSLAVVILTSKGLWWVLFAVFIGASISLIGHTLIRDLNLEQGGQDD